MNWLDGSALRLYGCEFKPCYTQIKLSFCQISLWQECQRLETLVVEGGSQDG